MVKLDIILDEPSIDLSSVSESVPPSVPLSGRVVLAVEKPAQIKHISLKYDCINSHTDFQDVYVFYNLHRSTKIIPPGCEILPAGIHEYPFTFLVPKNLPPSLKAPLGEVNHRLRASIKRPGHVPTLFYRMTKSDAQIKKTLTVHNSDHTTAHSETVRMRDPDDPPEYSPSNRLEWSGQRRDGQIDWMLQGPASVHISHRIDLIARMKMAPGYGAVASTTVDLVQEEKYLAKPDPTVWTFPMEQVDEEDGDELGSASDDGFPETRTTGVSLKQSVVLTNLETHCREKRVYPLKPVTKTFPPPPDATSNTKGFTYHLAMSLPLPHNHRLLLPTHTSPLITISHRLRIKFMFSPSDTKQLGISLPIVILPKPTPNSLNALAVAELDALSSAEKAEDFWMVLVEEEGANGPNPQRSRMNSGGGRGGSRRDLPPQYDAGAWPLPNAYTQERRGSIPMGIAV